MARIGRIEVELGLQSGGGEAGILRALRRLDPRQEFGGRLTRGEWVAGGRLRAFLVAAPALPGVRAPVFGAVGRVEVTKDERRLLRALAAMRVGDDGLVDNYVFRLAIERGARAELVGALREFGGGGGEAATARRKVFCFFFSKKKGLAGLLVFVVWVGGLEPTLR